MSDAEIAARLTEALVAAAHAEAGAETEFVSVNVTLLRRAEIAAIAHTIERRSRTLLFLSAEASDAQGERIAIASSVHKLNT